MKPSYFVKSVAFFLVIIFIFPTASSTSEQYLHKQPNLTPQPTPYIDFDPTQDVKITVTITQIRSYDELNRFIKPDFYLKLFINHKEFTSPVWRNTEFVRNPHWSVTMNVPDDIENVSIRIQLWDKSLGRDHICDLSRDYTLFQDSKDIELIYSIKTGHWSGDDALQEYPDWDARGDCSGYGRLNGCDDDTIYNYDRDCELYFTITQNDLDKDSIPYWTEVTTYGTNPYVDNTGEDTDGDLIPIEWEHRWGYNPLAWDNHTELDPDDDGLTNYMEYLTDQEGFSTDPFRKDILLEIDQMQKGPNGEGNLIPEKTKDLLTEAFGKHNIVLHIDDQGPTIPYDANTSFMELEDIYFTYFLNEDPHFWRRGVFHYAPIIYRSDFHPGNAWPSIVGDWEDPQNLSVIVDCFQISTRHHDQLQYKYPIYYRIYHHTGNDEDQRAIIYASAMIHETGHVLGIYSSNVPGCDNLTTVYPWQKGFWVWRHYESVMNYGKMYRFVDYSDGSHGRNDFDDWSNINLKQFQQERNFFWHPNTISQPTITHLISTILEQIN